MSVPDLRDKWQQHAKDDDENVCLGHGRFSEWGVQISVDNRLLLRVGRLGHRLHSNVPIKVSENNHEIAM